MRNWSIDVQCTCVCVHLCVHENDSRAYYNFIDVIRFRDQQFDSVHKNLHTYVLMSCYYSVVFYIWYTQFCHSSNWKTVQSSFFSSLDTIFIISSFFSLIFFLVVVVWHLFFKHFSIWWCHFVFWSTLWFDGRQIDNAIYWNAASMEFIKTECANQMANIRFRLFKVNSKKEQSWLFTLSPIRQSTAAPHSATAQQLQ